MCEWIKNAKVGDKVECVSTWDGITYYGEVGPVAGSVYTIREIGILNPDYPEMVTVRLVELVNEAREYSLTRLVGHASFEPSFDARRFRPVEPRKTDISIFTDMLKTADKPLEVA